MADPTKSSEEGGAAPGARQAGEDRDRGAAASDPGLGRAAAHRGEASPAGETSDRTELDAGRAGNWAGHPDPAMAPLGTDAEAGGAPARDEIARDGAGHPGRRPQAGVDHGRSTAQPAGIGRHKLPVLAIAAGAILLVVLLLIWAFGTSA